MKILINWWSQPLNKLIKTLDINKDGGLTSSQVKENKVSYGANTLTEIKPAGVAELILEGVKEPMMIVLLSIGGISLLFGKPVEALVMAFVVAAYIGVEFINKFRTDRTMASLRELTEPTTKVLRDGKHQEIPTGEVVVGDVVILTEGVRVPADIRLIESFGLIVNEASLTGESLPVKKDTRAAVKEVTPLAERLNSVFSGTTILSGEGTGIVMAVGEKSQLGTIATEVQAQRKEKTYIQNAMTKLAKTLAVLAIVVSIIIPTVGFLRGQSFEEMVLTWLALTFLMIPGQPPVIITMSLALASFALAKSKLVVKRLRGVEILGQVTVIVTDKTGTITENKMQADTFILEDGKQVKPQQLSKEVSGKIALCLPQYSSDPTDKAVLEIVMGIEREAEYVSLEGFAENKPWRTMIYKQKGLKIFAFAGEPEAIIRSTNLSETRKTQLLDTLKSETNKGNRVVAYAYKENGDQSLQKTQFLVLAVLSDPIRPGVKEALAKLGRAGIDTYIVTGDHPTTARTIAQTIGLQSDVLQGSEIETLSDNDLTEKLLTTRVFARISPSQKKRLVTLLKKHGETVAVIGDGVNDAPALKAGSVGIAMGEIGTDLAKETADLVLTDDNYVHLPEAIRLGRKALDNFRKGLTYYLSAKAILLSIFIVPLALGIPFPFAPIMIILTELLMDLASSTIFVTESVEPDVLHREPQKITNFLSKTVALRILRNGALLAVGILIIYLWLYYQTNDVVLAQTAAFVTWLLGHIMLALNLKQEKLSLLKQGIFSNRFGSFWLVGMILLSLSITFLKPLYPFVHTTSIPVHVWVGILAVVIASTWWIEVVKLVQSKNLISERR